MPRTQPPHECLEELEFCLEGGRGGGSAYGHLLCREGQTVVEVLIK